MSTFAVCLNRACRLKAQLPIIAVEADDVTDQSVGGCYSDDQSVHERCAAAAGGAGNDCNHHAVVDHLRARRSRIGARCCHSDGRRRHRGGHVIADAAIHAC